MAFSAILADDTREFYYETLMNRDLEFITMVNLMRESFEIKERQIKFLSHWNKTSLMEVKERNPDKTLLECFDIIYRELRKY